MLTPQEDHWIIPFWTMGAMGAMGAMGSMELATCTIIKGQGSITPRASKDLVHLGGKLIWTYGGVPWPWGYPKFAGWFYEGKPY